MKTIMKSKILLLIISIILISIVFVGCDHSVNVDTPKTISVNCNDGDNLLQTLTLDKLNTFTPQKEGYIFDGWYLDKDCTTSIDQISNQNTTVYANWKIQTFTVKFLDKNGMVIPYDGKETQTVNYNGSAIAPSAPEFTGFNFVGWDKIYDNVKTNLIINAIYVPSKFTLTFYKNDDEIFYSKETTYTEDLTATFNTITDTMTQEAPLGLDFKGWRIQDDTTIVDLTILKESTSLYPVYEVSDIGDFSITSSAPDNIVYTEDLSITLSANYNTYENIDYLVEWYKDGDKISNGDTLVLNSLNASEHAYTARLTASYDSSSKNKDCNKTINVSKATITNIETLNIDCTYNAMAISSTLTGAKDSDTISYSLDNNEFSNTLPEIKDAGEYIVYIKVERENYNSLETSFNVNINKAPLNVLIEDKTIKYGDIIPEFTCIINGFIAGENSSVLTTSALFNCTAQNTANIGEFDITASNITAKNYYVANYTKGSLKVEKAPLKITLNNANIEYGQSAPEFSANYDGFKFSDSASNLTGQLQINTTYNVGNSVGRYDITATGVTSNCYEISIIPAFLNVTKATLQASVVDKTLTYGDNIPTNFEITYSGFVCSDDISCLDLNDASFTTTYTNKSPVNSNGYTVSLSNIQSENYEIVYNPGKINLVKKELMVSVNNTTTTYGTLADILLTYSGFANEDDASCLDLSNLTYTTSYSISSAANSQGYEVAVSNIASNNYNISYTPGLIVVNKKDLSISVSNESITYGASAPEYSIQANGFVNNDDLTSIQNLRATSSYIKGNNVGQYPITLSGTSQNYNITFNDAVLTVNPKDVTITIEDKEIVYGDAIPSLTYRVHGLYMNDNDSDLNINLSTAYEQMAKCSKDNYEITATYNNPNYNATIFNGSIIVNKKVVEVSYSKIALKKDTNFTADASLFTFTGFVGTPVVSGTLILNKNDYGTYTTTDKTLGENFTWQSFDVLLNEESVLDCYDFKYTISVEISDQQFEYTVNSINTEYSSYANTFSVTADLNNYTVLYSLNNIDFTSDLLEFTNVQNTTVYFKIIDNAAYDPCDTISSSSVVIIEKAPLSLIADNKSITYGDTAADFTYSAQGLKGSDTLAVLTTMPSLSTNYVVSSNAGEYIISINNATADNYSISYTNGVLTVQKKALTVSVNNITVTYGDLTPSSYDLSYTGFILSDDENSLNLDSAAYTTTYTNTSAATSVGYDVSVSNIESTNYIMTYNPGKIIVNKKALSITANNKSITYGDAIPQLDATYSGLISTDDASSISNLTISTTYTQYSNVGSYAITLANATSNNYDITYNSGNITVGKKAVTLTANNKTITFGDNASAYTYSTNGLIENAQAEQLQNVQLTSTYSIGDSVGTYPINITCDSATNYIVSFNSATLSVTQRPVEIVWTHQSVYTYNGSNQASSVSAKYATYTSEFTLAQVSFAPNAEFKNAGNYTATATITDNNYVISSNSSLNLVMNKANYSSISHTALSGVYNPSYTLANYPLDTGFTYINQNEIPTCVNTQYDAKYNLDPANYNDYSLAITINLEKAQTTLAATIFEENYSASTYVVNPTIIYNNNAVNSSLYNLTYSNGDSFVNAGTYKSVVTMTADNYKLDPTAIYIKIKGVLIGSTYYTIEDALNAAVSGNLVIVKNNTSFADSSFASEIYSDSSYYTVKSGVELLVPYDDAGTKALENVVSDPASIGSIFRHLTIPANITITCNGTINVNAKRGYSSSNAYQGGTVENYGQLTLEENATINMKSGSTYSSNGFTVGRGTINLESGAKAYDVLIFTMWIGGHAALSSYKEIFVTDQYLVQNIEVHLNAYYGSTVYGRYYLHTKLAAPKGTMAVMGNGAIFDLKSGYGSKYFNRETGKLEICAHGNVSTNSATIKIGSLASVDTASTEFPFPGNVDIYIKPGAHFTINNRFKFLPGSNLFVEENATLTIAQSGKLFFFTQDIEVPFNGTYSGTTPLAYNNQTARFYRKENGVVVPIYAYTKTMNANCVINGTLNINGSFGGVITTTSPNASVVVSSTAKLDDVLNYNLVIIKQTTLGAEYSLTKDVPLYGRIYTNGATAPSNIEVGTYTALDNLTFTK